jgi:NAD(P)-dependent dehydrogenase (short-subunit alcohol dehydrogenase family)
VTIPNYGENSIRGTGTYIIAGGLGGLGKAICQWMSKHAEGVNIVLLSRSNSEERVKMGQDFAAKLQKEGTTLHVVACDVSDESQVKKAVEWCKASLPPIRGMIQGAMVLKVRAALLVIDCNVTAC